MARSHRTSGRLIWWTSSLALFFAPGTFACSGEHPSENGEALEQGSGGGLASSSGGTDQEYGASGGNSGAGGNTAGSPGAGGSAGGSPGTGGSTGGSLGAGGGTGGLEGGGGGADFAGDSEQALVALERWLFDAPSERSELDAQAFSTVPLTTADATEAHVLLWNDLAAQIRSTRQSEVDEQSISLDGFTLAYETVLLGDNPPDGRSLFISMHGGGSAPKETNDEQWQNQILLAESYAPKDALWIAPRAPTDDWNMWFKDHIIPLFDRLISNMIVFEGIHPNKVYLTGYSAGGDGVYQLGPTMADRWAGAAMSAGHPNDMTPTNLRNIAFAIHVGGDDTAFDRNLVAAQWGEQLANLRAADPAGYPHQVQVHEGLPHWMNLADQPSVPYIQSFVRDVFAKRVVWRQSTLLETRFYWLKVAPEHAVKDAELIATIDGQTIELQGDVTSGATILLSDALLDLDQEVVLSVNGTPVSQGTVPRTILALYRSLKEREDPAAAFSAELSVP